MVADIVWNDRESYVMNPMFLDGPVFFGLPHDSSWNICNKIIYKNKIFKLYLRLLSEENEPKIYTESGHSEYLNNVWDEVKSAIINNTKSDYVR